MIVMEGNWLSSCAMWEMCHKTSNMFTCYYCGVLEIINLFVVINFGAFSCFIYFCCMYISPCELWMGLIVCTLSSHSSLELAFMRFETYSTSRYATLLMVSEGFHFTSFYSRNTNYSVSITLFSTSKNFLIILKLPLFLEN
jgi:hypothetical protein